MAERDLAGVLREYGAELAASAAAQVGDAFTWTDADAFLKSSPNAFLIGVLFTQGMPAERAWAGPYLLWQRLGHFDLQRLVDEPKAVHKAFMAPPALHRFVHTVPRWVCSAAQRLVEEYEADASRIWPDGSHVLDVTERLLAFDGIGEKKAAMAVELLMRHFGVRLEGVECGTVAYDVQVRRVFLRTGLIERDTPEDVRAAAARVCPEAPGQIDLPVWLIGRETCRPRRPACDRCRLTDVCPRLVERDARGVGVRPETS
ncbi:MAG: hypothetical protein JXE06_00590 [Coriobacteriia bacterium]|nr:hypothetical protein [Coriobacteriia bacterium]MBN2823235.1 hypothetical protein [Coriobacteriia bacterium]